MVDVVEQGVQLLPGVKPVGFGNEVVVGLVEFRSEAAKHSRNRKVKLMMAVEGGRIIYH